MTLKRKCQLDLLLLPLHTFLGLSGKKNLAIYLRALMKFLEVTKAFRLLKEELDRVKQRGRPHYGKHV